MDPGGKCKTELLLFGPKLATHGDLRGINRYLVVCVLFYFVLYTHASPAKPCDKNCLSGKCINGSCVCDRGWVGDQCQYCHGRFKLTEPSGYLTDGPINYKYKTKCTWLIEGYPNAVLRLRFNHFATECSWDHMYVYDGDSIFAPLVAVFSGLIIPEIRGNETVPEVETTSGYALLHFLAMPHITLRGLKYFTRSTLVPITAPVMGSARPVTRPPAEPRLRSHCSFNRVLLGFPSVKPFGTSLARASHKAVVQEKVMWVVGGYTFNYSSFQMILNYNLESGIWSTVPVSGGPVPRYGHSLAAYQDDIYMFGGKLEAGLLNATEELWVFNLPSRTWQRRTPAGGAQTQIYAVEGHSAHCVLLDEGEAIMLVIFGYSPIYSYVSNVQEYNLRSNTWVVPETQGAAPQGGYGHSSTFDSASGSVYVHGGYKAFPANKYGLVDDLYRYDANTRTWFILRESGSPRYLHSAVLLSGTLLFFGGNTHNDTSLSNGAKCFSADFLAYDIACDEWRVLPKPDLHRDVNRFGHSAVVSNGSMFVFGGFSGMLLNDLPGLLGRGGVCQAGPGVRCIWSRGRCFPWESSMANGSIIPAPFCPLKAVTVDERCYRFSDCASCTANTNGCQWCDDKKCLSASSNCTANVRNFTECPVRNEQVCTKMANCKSCSVNLNCQWDQNQSECHALPAQQCSEGWSQVGEACLRINSSRESYDNAQHYCKNLNGNIASLTTSKQVDFVLEELKKLQQEDKVNIHVLALGTAFSLGGPEEDQRVTGAGRTCPPSLTAACDGCPESPVTLVLCYLEETQVSGLRANPCTATAHGLICEKATGNPNQSSRPACKKPCSLHTNCANCTNQAWSACGAEMPSAVWTPPPTSSLSPTDSVWSGRLETVWNCSGLRTCSQCLEQPECGWCGDPSSTGKGLCTEGSYRGPLKRPAKQGQQVQPSDMVLEPGICPKDKGFEWAFIHCPACQCNGHSTCVNGSVCEQCRNLTTGPHCQTCMPGYHGDPTNGGKCQACKCNGHANVCQVLTGKCFCTTKGIKGDQCQLCDSENRYLGNPLRGTCYYNLLIDYQFTFSLIQEDDNHYTAINFMASPEQANKNLDMSINASNNFNLNITWSVGSTAGTISGEEVPIVSKTNIKEYRDSFSCEKYTFRSNPNITFYVYVSNFSWPIKIQIAFSQHNSIMDLVQFFVTFFSCFLSLLLVAAVVWKIKQTCWASRRREQLMRERQQMASRPFASVALSLDSRGEETELLHPVVEGAPKPVAMEPCSGGKAAVLTVLMRLPSGLSDLPPPGQSGLIVASALIDISQQKPSDFKDKSHGLKNRKAHHPSHQGTCV
ncbi:hypothetical protein F7725_014314 [Dissostichus mawsoni]|uniref:Attractin-like protein 1 n=1 Tax=Dissostichus mawsoni TaxID=36200 RepID=A0A7J5YW20_DISMA|nr:hypothetical protein F7725_014314 [Dissostichus mawsoni]